MRRPHLPPRLHTEWWRTLLDRPFDLGFGFVLTQSGVGLWLQRSLTPMHLWSDATLSLTLVIAGVTLFAATLLQPRLWANVVRQAACILSGCVYLATSIILTYPPINAPAALALASGVVIAACFILRAAALARDRRALLDGLNLAAPPEEE